MVTNECVKFKKIDKIFNSGLNKLLISVYDGYEDTVKFQELCEEAGLSEHQFLLDIGIYRQGMILVLL